MAHSPSYPESYVKMLRQREADIAKCHDMMLTALQQIEAKGATKPAWWSAETAKAAIATLDAFNADIEARDASSNLQAAE